MTLLYGLLKWLHVLIASLVLFVVVVLTHLVAYRPVLSRMSDLLDCGRP